jgi:hypothetical protein
LEPGVNAPSATNCWSERAKEAIRTADTSDRSAFEKKLIFRLMYLRDVRESALSNAYLPASTLSIEHAFQRA